MTDQIATRHLSKNFGRVHAVDDLSLHVRKGEIYGFLGLNGAGKTTTIRTLLGMIRPTSGEAYLFGRKVNPARDDIWKDVGHLVEIPYSYPDLTVRENLEMMRRMRFVDDPRSVDAIIEKLQLGAYRDRPAKNLSLGNAQRLGLAKALLHHPKILILDEPANGLDPAGIVEVRELLKDLAVKQGVTIFISSHILDEISRFANRIGIIHQGRLVQEVDAEQLDHLLRRRILLRTRNNQAAMAALKNGGYSVILLDEDTIELKDAKALSNPENIATLLVRAENPPFMLKVDEEDLETYFLRVIGETGGAA